ncbi:MAG: glycosyl hydrolase [Acidobacteriota bacterium]|nr:glycosyl hydrolase [Blastocatellia bacterium]MDW8411050.1 glycosyl hydrolase [Acidobacteriota bacterium]
MRIFLVLFCLAIANAQVKFDSVVLSGLEARAIGPAVMSGRVTAIEAQANDPRIVWVGAASGGVWKSTNAGTSFKPVFDKYVQSIGAIAIDPKQADTVWVGTGESNVRNSVSIGAGLYKTTDGGQTWALVGLEKVERISKIVIDPKNPEVVYVACPGALWSQSSERGLYKTTDGGKSWEKILYVDENTGCADVAIDPQEPNVVYASMWQFRRKGWFFTSGGPGSGLYKSTDGGKSWKKLTAGLPEGELGRIAIAVAPSRPSTVYANVEARQTALYRSDDMGENWKRVNSSLNVMARPFYFSFLAVDPKDHRKVYKLGLTLGVSRDGGESFFNIAGETHTDHHALWIDPNNTSFMYLGTDGGVYKSYDGGQTWSMLRNLPVSQFYRVWYDLATPYNVYGGLQDNGTWTGPSRSFGGIKNKEWKNVGYGDGFYSFPDPTDPDIVYSEYQGGRLLRYHRATGEIKHISPATKINEPKLRFNWNTPFQPSRSSPGTIYLGSQYLFASTDKGESWVRLSPDLTTNDPEKQRQEESGGLTIDNSAAENHCTIYAISDSPKDPQVIWTGSDDGLVQITRDGGKTWQNVTANIPGLEQNSWVSSIEASSHDPATAYVTFDRHTFGDMKPYVYRTTDYGKTWQSIVTDDIKGFAHVIREDLVNPELLFLGTELGLYVSIDGGTSWARFTSKFPEMVPVRDLAIHPREHDLIIATHGRGIYIVDDISVLRQLKGITEKSLHIFSSRPSIVQLPVFEQEFPGSDEFVGATLPEMAYITYYLRERHLMGEFKVEILDSEGKVVSTLPGSKRKGINRVGWPMRLKPPRVAQARSSSLEGGLVFGPTVAEGLYTVRITRASEVAEGVIELVPDSKLPHSASDRKLRHETVMQLYELQGKLAYIADAVELARKQAEDRSQKLTTELKKRAESLVGRLDQLHKSLVATKEGLITGEERLRERIITLYQSVMSYGGRPSSSQLEQLDTLQKEVVAARAEFGQLLRSIEEMNSALRAKKIEPIEVLTEEAWLQQQQ